MPKTAETSRLAAMAQTITFGANGNLNALDEAIEGARVVLLGEQSHGDGAAFEVKTRIVEHLHVNHGFDVLAFEADFYALERTWRETRTEADVAALAQHVYAFWREGPKIEPLWALVRSRLHSERPLAITGIDSRHSGSYPKAQVAQALEAFLELNGAPLHDTWPRFRTLLVDLLEKEYQHRVDAGDRELFLESLFRLLEKLNGTDDASAFWRQELSNLTWTARNAWGFEGRDEGMGRNLTWLATDRYPGKKIVVWTHNFHIVRSAAALNAHHAPYDREREMYPDSPVGEVAVRQLGSAVRSIALIAGRGWYTPNAWSGDNSTRAVIDSPPPRSLEHALLVRGVEHAYLNLSGEQGAFPMCGAERGVPISAPWGRIFDGVIYQREMTGLGSTGDPRDG